MKKYEYQGLRYSDLDDGGGHNDFVRIINVCGKQGWRIISSPPNFMGVLLEREIPDQPMTPAEAVDEPRR